MIASFFHWLFLTPYCQMTALNSFALAIPLLLVFGIFYRFINRK